MPRAKPGGMRLFGEEPEEAFNRSRTPSAGSKAKPSPGTSAVLFGDEEEEAPSAAGKVESESDDDDDDDDDEGVVTQPATLHLNWSGLKMFEQVSFLKRAAEKSKPAEKKRAYDNSKRLEKVVAKPHRSYQSQALKSERLINLFNKKALSLAPDLRVGKVNAGQRQAAYSVDAFLSVLYEGVAETLPNRFIRRGQSEDDPSFDVETDDVEELKDWLDHPGRGAAWQSIAPDSKRLTKYLPPGTVRDLYEHYQSTRQLYTTFMRAYNERWKDVLRFREANMFSQCEQCFHFKRDLAAAKSLEEKLGTLLEYRRHLSEQYQDRTLLWMMQEASLDPMSDVLVCQIDGMDQEKFRLPRDPGLRCTASLRLDLSL
eukprot:symbB.v1.2.017297.t1/scaffold1343.1/size124258/6